MEKWKLLIVAVGVIALIAGLSAVADVYAQEEEQAPGTYKTPEEMQKPSAEGINSGWVVAYGVLIRGPYNVTLKNDTVFISGIPYQPSIRYADPEYVVSAEANIKNRYLDSLIEAYEDDYMSLGQTVAIDNFMKRAKRDTLISKLKFDQCENPDLTVTWWDGRVEEISLHVGILARQGCYPNKELILNDLVKSVMGDLKAKNMVAFGNGYHRIIPHESAQEILRILQQARNREISQAAALKELSRLGIAKFAQEVIENIDRW